MLQNVADFLFSTGRSFFNSFLSDWDILGYAIISFFIFPRVVNFIKRFFR